jgi:hypothetical protein
VVDTELTAMTDVSELPADISHLLHDWREARLARTAAMERLNATEAAVVAAERQLQAAGVDIEGERVTWQQVDEPGPVR